MNSNKNIYWNEGLFLKPQHFQFTDKKIDDSFLFIIDKLYNYNTGFIDLKIDLNKLENGILSINSCRLLTNNTYIDYPTNSNLITLNIKDKIENNSNKKFYIGLKKYNKDITNIEISSTKELSSLNTRYNSIENDIEEISDIYNNNKKADFRYAKYTLSIFSEDEISSIIDYELIEFCNILNKDSKLVLKENWVPPFLFIKSDADNPLIDKIVNMYKMIMDSIKILEKDKLKSQNLIILSNIGKNIVDIKYILKSKYITPSLIFKEFEKVISSLLIFTTKYNISYITDEESPIKYHHNDIYNSFELLELTLKNMFDEIIEVTLEVEKEFIFPFDKDEDKYIINIEEQFIKTKHLFYLEFITNDRDKLIEHIQYLKISNNEFIDTVIFSSISDINFKLLNKSDINFPMKATSVYIKIDTTSQNWNKILDSRDIAIYIDQHLIQDANLILVTEDG